MIEITEFMESCVCVCVFKKERRKGREIELLAQNQRVEKLEISHKYFPKFIIQIYFGHFVWEPVCFSSYQNRFSQVTFSNIILIFSYYDLKKYEHITFHLYFFYSSIQQYILELLFIVQALLLGSEDKSKKQNRQKIPCSLRAHIPV